MFEREMRERRVVERENKFRKTLILGKESTRISPPRKKEERFAYDFIIRYK